ncbi:MAG: periplasmic heavy metal sensor [Nitrospirae bacterium]|nr:periplasmic heavy metal sensor [Nitrospirota bacterium]
MKHYVTIAAILLLILAFGINGAIAQSMGQNEGMKAQDPPPGHMGMMGGGMKCDKMGGGMKDGGSCGCMKHDKMMERAHHMKMMLMHLGLDEKQKAQIDGIMTSHVKDVIKKKADLQIAKVDLKNIISKDPVDMKAAESKLKEIEAMKTALILAHLNAHQKIKSLLTPEQQTKMKEMMEMHMMGGGMKDGGCCGGMMKGDMMKEMGHHDHEKMMK